MGTREVEREREIIEWKRRERGGIQEIREKLFVRERERARERERMCVGEREREI